MTFNSISDFVWGLVGLGISIAIALFVLNIFLPVGAFFEWVAKLFGPKIFIRCKKCKMDNLNKSKFCSNCGTEL